MGADRIALIFIKLMLVNLLNSQCCCFNFSEEIELQPKAQLTEQLFNNNKPNSEDHNKNNFILWRDENERKSCIALATSKISLSLHSHSHHSQSEKNAHKTKNKTVEIEIDLISVNSTTVQIETLCNFNPKVLKISFNNSNSISTPGIDGVLKFYFLTQQDSYRLVLVDLVVEKTSHENGVRIAKSNYFAFRATEDFHKNETLSTPFGRSSFCKSWIGLDALAETWINIEDLQYQVLENGKFFHNNGTQHFTPIGHYCSEKDDKIFVELEQVGWWDVGRSFKTPFYKFLFNIVLLLGGCGLVILTIFGLCKFCPSKVKQLRKSVFQV